MQTKSPEELFPPCAAACPVGTDARRYVGLIFQGRYEEAMEVIKANNVIPSVCAYICAHPCEDACRRQYVEGPLAIRALKRFVMDHTREYRRSHLSAGRLDPARSGWPLWAAARPAWRPPGTCCSRVIP